MSPKMEAEAWKYELKFFATANWLFDMFVTKPALAVSTKQGGSLEPAPMHGIHERACP